MGRVCGLTLRLPCFFYIRTEGFKARAVFNFCHSTSPTYILYFIVCTWNDVISTLPTFYISYLGIAIIRLTVYNNDKGFFTGG